jgi:hypothetical protein
MICTRDIRLKKRLYDSLNIIVLVTFVILFSTQTVFGAIPIGNFGNWDMYVENSYDTYPVFNTFLFSSTKYTVNGKISDQQIVGTVVNISQYHNKMFFAFQFATPIGLTVNDPNVRIINQFGDDTYAVRLLLISVKFYDTLQQDNKNKNTSNKNKNNTKIYIDVYAAFNPELYNTAYVIMDDRFINELLTHKYCEITITVGKKIITFVVDTYGLKEGVSQLMKLYSNNVGL